MSNSFIEQVGGIQQNISQPCFIGIIAKHYKDGSKYPEGNQYSYSSDDLSNAISDNGGVPLILTSGGKEIIYANLYFYFIFKKFVTFFFWFFLKK